MRDIIVRELKATARTLFWAAGCVGWACLIRDVLIAVWGSP